MGDAGAVWRAAREARREKRHATVQHRRARFERLTEHPDVIVLQRLGPHGYRLIHFEWPQSRYVDFWPTTSAILTSDGRRLKGWVKLLREVGVPRGPWEVDGRT